MKVNNGGERVEELAKITSKVGETIGKRGPLKRAREICPFGPDSCTTGTWIGIWARISLKQKRSTALHENFNNF